MCFTPQQRALLRHLNFQKWSVHVVLCTFWFGNVLRATTACTFSTFSLENVLRATIACTFETSQLPKVVLTCGALHILTWKCVSRDRSVHFFDISTSKSGPYMWFLCILTWKCVSRHNRCAFSTSQLRKVVLTCGALYILTWTCASRHNGVHFFHISTSKSGLTLACFVHFDLEMCFAPQRRALFPHLNFQKWSEAEMFLYMTRKCASRQNGVQFFEQLLKVLRSWGVFVHFDSHMCLAPQRLAILHVSSDHMAPHPLL